MCVLHSSSLFVPGVNCLAELRFASLLCLSERARPFGFRTANEHLNQNQLHVSHADRRPPEYESIQVEGYSLIIRDFQKLKAVKVSMLRESCVNLHTQLPPCFSRTTLGWTTERNACMLRSIHQDPNVSHLGSKLLCIFPKFKALSLLFL